MLSMSDYPTTKSAKKELDITFYVGLVKFGEVNVPPEFMQYFKESIAMVEKRANINVAEYIGFGSKGTAQYKFKIRKGIAALGYLIGEMN